MRQDDFVSLRPAYLTITNLFSALRLLPINDRDKDTEILALRRQTTVPERQLGTDRTKFTPADRAFLAALLIPLPRQALRHLWLLVRSDTVLRRHHHLIWQRHEHNCNMKTKVHEG
ncbi:hypothetical protein ACOKM3_08500 [Streptomyces sp. BH106]|uniref:hypothetical protein n=1 Tax=Streptomyces sp. BH106 TaxID=3410409 RepID=UPI003CF69D88